MSWRSRVASIGEAPPVPIAATTSPRSITAGVVKSQSGRAVDHIDRHPRRPRRAGRGARQKASSGEATKARTAAPA